MVFCILQISYFVMWDICRGNKELLMSDTVGFIQKLPTELVAAFR